jgi:hypothetical protein
MIALITSALNPPTGKSYFSFQERVQQTQKTLLKLNEFRFEEIMLFDNSELLNQQQLEVLLKDFPLIKSYHSRQYLFKNKGLTEALLILNNLHYIPDNKPIFKISGRYYPTENFRLPDIKIFDTYDFVGIGTDFDKRNSGFSTRGYYVKNKQVLESTLVLVIEEILSYANGIHGINSFWQWLLKSVKPVIGVTYQLSLEQAFARVLKHQKNFLLLNKLHIEGYVAGSDFLDFVTE